MIRVLQVIGGMNLRGAETFLMNVYRKINRTQVQFDFLVYSNDKQDYEDEILSLGGRVIHMPCSRGIGAYKSIKSIKEIIRQYGPYKAIHAQTLYNISYALLAAKSFPEILRISHSHSTKNALSANFLHRLYERWAAYVIRRETQVMVACGEDAGEFLFGEKFKTEGIVLKNGIDLDKHCPKNHSAIYAIKSQYQLEDKLVIGAVGHFYEVKNHRFMIEIAESLKEKSVDFKMLLVGKGVLQDEIKQIVLNKGLQDKVVFLDTRTDIPDLMHVFDIFLMPSHFEGNPVTLVEAQAAGTHCVMSDVITDEMDMGLNLITKISLNKSACFWAEKIAKISKKKNIEETLIRTKISACGYDAQATADQLINIIQQR